MTRRIGARSPTTSPFLLSAITATLLSGTAITAVRAETATPTIYVNASRLYEGITGASTSVITAEDIARSPAQSLQEVLAQVPGVQIQSLFGGMSGPRTTVDVRGFGAFATSNTLVLINGRRINDLDIAGVDFSTIPRESIERIEVTKGNSGAVLYGDNAIGGVINIITKTGVAGGKPVTMRVEGGVGSYGQREGNLSATTNFGPWSTAAFGNMIHSDGYRVNNAFDQRNGIGEIRYTTTDFSAFANISGDDQHLGLPGGRRVTPTTSLLVTDRRGAATPLDFGDQQGINGTAGFTKKLWDGAELIVDGGARDKKQQGSFFGTFADNYVDSALLTWSITPRISIKNNLLGVRSEILTGIDYYDATFDSNRGKAKGLAPIHVYNLTQKTTGAYWQQTLGVLPTTDFSYGGRIQGIQVTARDRYDPTAPTQPFFTSAQDAPLNSNELQHALHVGIEHRFTNSFAVFARAARAFRTPNVDERVGAGPHLDQFFNSISSNFALATQTSRDVEGGFKFNLGGFNLQSSIYDMRLKNEIHFDPFLGYNVNLDPTHRYGSETSASLQATDTLKLRGGIAITRAVFADGSFKGNDIPLVSRWSGNAGLTWNIWQQYAVLDATARFWGTRHLDNDQRNDPRNPLIPANATIDLKLSGAYDRFFWSAAVNNLFDNFYYDYGIASQFTPGNYSAYPLPGRTFVVKLGATF